MAQPESEEGCGRWRESQRVSWAKFYLREVRDVQGMAERGACHTWLQLSWVCVADKPLSRFVQGTEALVKLSFSLEQEERAHVRGASYDLLPVQHHEPRQGEETPRRTVAGGRVCGCVCGRVWALMEGRLWCNVLSVSSESVS